jgi:hypothetical protein
LTILAAGFLPSARDFAGQLQLQVVFVIVVVVDDVM